VKGQRDYERPVEEMISCLGLEKRGPPKIARVRGATPMAEYALPILQALVERGGKATREEVFHDIRATMEHRFNTLDLQVLTDSRTPRWQRMADWQRFRMVQDGLLRSDCPHGTWEITERGRQRLASIRNTS
jgi:hypothetical protein